MVALVSNFLDTLKKYTEEDTLGLKQITGCGIPYTGSGVVDFYKFNKWQLKLLNNSLQNTNSGDFGSVY